MSNNDMRAIRMSEFATGAMSATSAARLMSRKTLQRFVVAFGLFVGALGATQIGKHTLGLSEVLNSGIEPSNIQMVAAMANRPSNNVITIKSGPKLER